jgi:hypothetical protein
MNQHQRRFADRTAKTAGETVHGGNGAANQFAHGLGQGYFAAAEAFRDFNVRLFEMAHANAMATFDLGRAVATAKSPLDAAMLWSSHARMQFETLTQQTRELTALAQRVATSGAAPLTRSFGQTLRGTS